MKTRFEKNLRITGDLMLYCHHRGGRDISSNIVESEGHIKYTVTAFPVYMDDEKLEELTVRLNAPRQMEYENDYWELMGESKDFSELMLIGTLCDEADIAYKDNVLTITLLRYD